MGSWEVVSFIGTEGPAPVIEEIRGVTWVLTGIHDGKSGFTSVLGDVMITLLLDDDGRLSGSSGCNR